jgi:hypothetical protein
MGITVERTPDGRRLVVAEPLTREPAWAWDLLCDTERWPEWGPSVRAVDCDGRYVETGTTGRVRIPGGVWLPFEVTSCVDRRWTWRVARIPATGHTVDERPGGCRVGFELPLYAAGYAPVCRRALGRIAELADEN